MHNVSIWYLYIPWPWQKMSFIDGTTERGTVPVFRRRVDASWQYRRLTPEEEETWQRDQAW